MSLRKNRLIPVLICVNFLAPMAYVEYQSVWLEWNGAWIVLPWCNLTLRSLELHNYYPLAEKPELIWFTGILWVLLGLMLVPILRVSIEQSRWLFALANCFMVLIVQISLVVYGYRFAARSDVLTEVLALPISSLFSILVVVMELSRNYVSDSN